MHAIGIARVSTKDQEEGYSIPAQVTRIKEYASSKGFSDIEIYELSESSTKETRKKFEKIIEFIKKSNDCISLFVETIDRLQRDFKESVVLDELRKKGKLRIYFFRENLMIDQNSNSSEIMRWDIGVFTAKMYVTQLSDNVKRSISKKLLEGEWVGKAPPGYLNINKEDGSISHKSEGRGRNKGIILDIEKSPFIIKAFEMFSSGFYSIQGLSKELGKQGFTLRTGKKAGKTSMHRILKNPFYYGEMICKGKKFKHHYETLIPQWLFDKCQDILEGRASNERGTQYNKKEFLFKGIIHCHSCGKKLSTYTQKGINYVRCHSCNKVHEREDTFEKQIEAIFQEINIPEDVMLDLVSILKETHNKEQNFTLQQQSILIQERARIQKKIEIAYEDRLDGRITGNEYDKKVLELKAKDFDILEQIKEHSKGDEVFLITSSYILELAHRAYSIFKGSQTSTKRELINFVFTNFEADGSKLLYKTKEPFGEVLFCSKNAIWLGMRDSNPR